MIEIVNIDFEIVNLDEFDGNIEPPKVEALEHAADGTTMPSHPNIVSGYIMTCMSEQLGRPGLIVTDKNFRVGSFSLEPNGMAGVEPLYSIETNFSSFLFRLMIEGNKEGQCQLRVRWGGDVGQVAERVEPISDEPHLWEILGKRAKTGISCDGGYKLFVDAVLVDRREKVSNFHSWNHMTVAMYGAMCEFGLAGRNTDA